MPYSNIDKPNKYFNTVTYSGNSTDGRSLTGVGFKPDLVWIKIRSTTGGSTLQDIVRGANKFLSSNSTNAEITDYNLGYLSSFTSDGFVLEQGSDPTDGFLVNNATGQTYVAWNWLGANTTASNTSGTITSTVSANTISGFSVCTYTGDGGTTTSSTIGHGLGVAPKIYFLKGRSEVGDWIVASSMFTNLQFLKLNLTNALASGGTAQYVMNSSTISVPARNTSGQTYVAYCFAEIKGYSKFGSYIGNGSTDGTFVYTGFKPAFFITKRTDTTSQWQLLDNKRLGYNASNSELYSDSSEVENTVAKLDILSNGFKLRTTSTTQNASGGTYIYMAFAENPFVSSKGIPTTAR